MLQVAWCVWKVCTPPECSQLGIPTVVTATEQNTASREKHLQAGRAPAESRGGAQTALGECAQLQHGSFGGAGRRRAGGGHSERRAMGGGFFFSPLAPSRGGAGDQSQTSLVPEPRKDEGKKKPLHD